MEFLYLPLFEHRTWDRGIRPQRDVLVSLYPIRFQHIVVYPGVQVP